MTVSGKAVRAAWSAGLLALVVMAGGITEASAEEPAAVSAPEALTAANALQRMSPGWNLGNTLEAIGNGPGPFKTSQETAWGNPAATQELMDAVRDAGFKSVRIPVAWKQYADKNDTINPAWMKRVREVVGYARKSGLYVVLNVHWDGGWIQPTYADQAQVNARLRSYWTQIATEFADADDGLLFAGTNEIMVPNVYSAPTEENCKVQNGFNQVFVDAVRATGGKNATRFLVVQGYNTNIDYTLACNARMPGDTAAGRLMMEVHNYDPYNFTLNDKSQIWQWGKIAKKGSATETWANESYTDGQFQKLKRTFVDKGVPVILGEYSAMSKTEFDPTGTYRTYWNQYLTQSAYQHGVIPMYWDNGYTSNHQAGLFDRAQAKPAFPETIKAIVEAAQ